MYDQVYTCGFFNNFHQGHWKLLTSMRKKGNKIFVGVYDDQHLKIHKNLKNGEYQPLEIRMSKVKEFADVVFVIPSLDPEMYIKMIMDNNPYSTKCYVRADNIKYYPAWKWIKSNFAVELIPYVYQLEDEELDLFNSTELNLNIKLKSSIPQILKET